MRRPSLPTLLIAALLAAPTLADAQALRGWGFKAGYSKANQDWSNTDFHGVPNPKWEPLESVTAGAFAEFNIKGHLSALAALVYEQHGIRAEAEFPQFSERSEFFDGVEFRYKARFDYLAVAAVGKWRLREQTVGKWNPFVKAGPVYSVFLDEHGSASFVFDNGNITIRPTPFSERNTWSLKTGIGFEIPVRGPATYLVEADYTFGLSNTLRRGDGRDRLLAATFGIRF